MKITGIKLIKRTCKFDSKYKSETNQVSQIDVYREYAEQARQVRPGTPKESGKRSGHFIEISTDGGLTGQYGVIESRPELFTIMDGLRDYLIGRDPLENRLLWDLMSR